MDALTVVISIAARQNGTVTRDQAIAAGLGRHEIDELVRRGVWRRLFRGTYLVEAREASRRAEIRAAVASAGPDAVAVLGTAAELHGLAGPPPTGEIHVSLPGPQALTARMRDPAMVLHQLTIPAAARVTVDGIPATALLPTVADVILRADRYAAVCLLDSALNRGTITTTQFGAVAALIRGRRGAVAARRYLAEADGRAESPLETRVRLRCVDGGVPPDTLQHIVYDAEGDILGRGDLAWRSARLLAEADGREIHALPEAVFLDRRRQNRLLNAGWVVLRFTWADTMRADYIPYVVREAMRLRRHQRPIPT